MKYDTTTVEAYMQAIPDERRPAMQKLREVIGENIPEGFLETISYGIIGYVVPLATFPEGYHVTPGIPLPFINLASQKNFIALYHMGLYADLELLAWWQAEYPKHSKTKLDMGKSCIRFKNINQIPFELIGQLASKMTVDQWIELYQAERKS